MPTNRASEAPPLTMPNPLLKFSLQGQAVQLEEMAVAQKPLLGPFCLTGQGTVLCAPPNAGKTLITISLIIEAIEGGRISGPDVIYINADDTTQGIADKVRVLDEYGVHMIAQGYMGFKATMLTELLEQMIEEDSAKGKFLCLDTFKKFTQPMNKKDTSSFTDVIRRFVLKGGTLLCLSHTNKNPDADGRNVFAGVSDIIDDLDCAYIIDVKDEKDGDRVATFRNKKRRGNTPDIIAYTYSSDPALSYVERLTSVRGTDPEIDEPADTDTDDENILTHLELFIKHQPGMGKMKLIRSTAARCDASKRRVLRLLEAHTGDDPGVHRWSYLVRERGRHAYELLLKPSHP